MPAPTPIPPQFLSGPFRREAFIDAGLPPKALLGSRFRRVFPNVWSVDRDLSHAERIRAASLALTDRAALSHVTRIQSLGLDRGDTDPLHFTVAGDLHIDIEGIFLHRTVVMPPTDRSGVTPAVAFIQCCADLRLIDLVVAGDWLLRHGHLTIEKVKRLAALHPWRPGANEVARVLPWLDGASRSPKESELRALVIACGLPAPEVNVAVHGQQGRQVAIVDLLMRTWMLALEYEGRQHADDPTQFARDITRYADLRRGGVDYVQITASMLASPRAAMVSIHRRLVDRGYSGPPPHFGPRWLALFSAVPPVPRSH